MTTQLVKGASGLETLRNGFSSDGDELEVFNWKCGLHTREILLQRNIKKGNSVGRVACFAVLGPSVEGENSLLQAAHCPPHMFCVCCCSLPTPIMSNSGRSFRGTGKVEA